MDQYESGSFPMSNERTYSLLLSRKEYAYLQITDNTFALLDFDHENENCLSNKYAILQRGHNHETSEE